MTVTPEIASRLAAKVASMTMRERGERAADLIDFQVPTEEDNLEFVKLICGPDAEVQELIDLLTRGRT
jgi:hypothetical protein